MTHTQIASRLTDYLYRGNHLDEDAAQLFFDVLCDALTERPTAALVLKDCLISADITRLYNEVLPEGSTFIHGEGI